MDLKNLHTFYTIIKEGSFSKAAKKLNYTQSTITFHVGQLEKELDVQLFEKIGRRMVLTKAGEQLIPYVEDVILSVHKMEEFQNKIGNYIGSLRIGAPESLLCFRLPPILKKFQETAPRISLSLMSMNSSAVKKALKEDKIDVGFLYTDNESEQSVIFEPIERYRLIIATSYEVKRKLEFLMKNGNQGIGITKIVQPNTGSLRRKFNEYFKEKNISVGNTIELRSTQTIINLVKNDMGLCFLPKFVLQNELDKHNLTEIILTGEQTYISSAIAYYKTKWISPAMELFIDILKSHKY